MQHRFRSFSLIAVVVVLTSFLAPHSAQADTHSAITAKTSAFYRWYVGHIKRNRDPFADRATMRRYTSRRLQKWLYSPAYREHGADYFLDAQDFDNDWDKVRTSNIKLRGSVATLTATLGQPKPPQRGIGVRKLQLKWVRENGTWKIDRVNNR